MSANSPVGIVGLGLMGAAFAARLIEAGKAVIGFDIGPARCRAFGDLGGEVAASAVQVMAQSRTAVIAVLDARQVEVLFDSLPRGADPACPIVICTTTCAPEEITRLARHADKLRLPLVEAPISGTSAGVRAGSAMVMIAGPAEAVEAAMPTLTILCPRQARVGRIGDAARTKLAINLILQNNRAALAEGIAFAESMGLDAATFLATARQSAAYSRVMDTKGAKMIARDFAPQSHISDVEGCRVDP